MTDREHQARAWVGENGRNQTLTPNPDAIYFMAFFYAKMHADGVPPRQDAEAVVLDLVHQLAPPGGALTRNGRHGSIKPAEGRLRGNNMMLS
jgi:hypothetical protein